MKRLTLGSFVAVALSLPVVPAALAADEGFVVVGGETVATTMTRTTEFESMTDSFLDTASTRRIDERRLLEARPARGTVRAEEAIAVTRPADPKAGARAFLRPSRGQAATVDRPGVVVHDATDAGEPGWGELRIHRPDARDTVFRIGTPSRSGADAARDDRSARDAAWIVVDGRIVQASATDVAVVDLDAVRRARLVHPRAQRFHRSLAHEQAVNPFHPNRAALVVPNANQLFFGVPTLRTFDPHFKGREFREFRHRGDIFLNPSARDRFFRDRDGDFGPLGYH